MSVSFATNALLTLEEYKNILLIDVANTSVNDDQITMLINGVSQEIEQFCGRKFITPSASIVEVFDGDDTRAYYVKHGRISGTVTLEYRQQNTWTTVIQATYPITIVEDDGLVYFNYNYQFWAGEKNWRITYKYGWTLASLPYDIKLATAQLAQIRQLDLQRRADLNSESFGDATTNYDRSQGIPQVIRAVLERYRKVHAC